jgi:hypothetical protein
LGWTDKKEEVFFHGKNRDAKRRQKSGDPVFDHKRPG